MTLDTFIQPPATTNKQRDKIELANERRISSSSLKNMIKGFNILTLQSTINDSADNISNKNVAESDLKSDPLVHTHNSNKKKGNITDTDTTK